MLPEVSLESRQNFGDTKPLEDQRAILRRAFDLGVTHFDLANNYGAAVVRHPQKTALTFTWILPVSRRRYEPVRES